MESFPSFKTGNPTFLIINSVSEKLTQLKLSEEAQKIVDAVGWRRCRLFPAVEACNLRELFCEHEDAELVHISTHGGQTDGVPVLHMRGDDVTAPELVRLFKQAKVSPTCLVLMGCDGFDIAKDLLAKHATLRYVLCTDRPVVDDLCVELSGEFYKALKSLPIEEAFEEAQANVTRYINKLPAVLTDESVSKMHEANSFKVWSKNKEKKETWLSNLQGFRLLQKDAPSPAGAEPLDSSGVFNESLDRSISSPPSHVPLDATFAASPNSSMSFGSIGRRTPARGCADSPASADATGQNAHVNVSRDASFRMVSPAVPAAPALDPQGTRAYAQPAEPVAAAEAANVAPTGDGVPRAATQAMHRAPGWTDGRILHWTPQVGVGGESITLTFGLEIESAYDSGLAPTADYEVYFDDVETPCYRKRGSVFVTCVVPPPPERLQRTSSTIVYLSIKHKRTGERITLDSTHRDVPFAYLTPENMEVSTMGRIAIPSSPRYPAAKAPPTPRASAQRSISFRDEPAADSTSGGHRGMAVLAYLCFGLSSFMPMEYGYVCLRTDSQEAADLALLHCLRTGGCVDRSSDLLLWCCTCDLVETALYLLSRGADVMRQPFVSIALRHKSRRVVSALLRHGAPVSAKDCLQNNTFMRPPAVPMLSWLDLPSEVKRPRPRADEPSENVATLVGCPVVTFDRAETPPAASAEPSDVGGSLSSSEVSEGVVKLTKQRSSSLFAEERHHARDMLRGRAQSDTLRSPRKTASEPQAGLDDISSTASSITSGGTVPTMTTLPTSSSESSPSSSATPSLAGSPPRGQPLGPGKHPGCADSVVPAHLSNDWRGEQHMADYV